MNRLEMRDYVRDMTLVAAHELADATIDVFLNEATQRIVLRRDWTWLHAALETIQPTETVDITTFSLPVLKIYDVIEDGSSFSLDFTTRSMLNFAIRGRMFNQPRVYLQEGNLLIFHPAFDGTTDVHVSFYQKPVFGPDDTDEPEPMPDEFDSVITDWACHRVWERQEDMEKSDAYRGRYEAGLGELIFFDNSSNPDRPKIHGQLASRRRRQHMPFLDGV